MAFRVRVPASRSGSTALLVAALLVLAGCAQRSAVYTRESFALDSPYQRRFEVDAATACEGARRALLGDGYVIDTFSAEHVKGRKAYRTDPDRSTFVEMSVVCAPDPTGSTLFANGLLSIYEVKTSTSSASVGVSAIGSVSLPFGRSADSMVKTGDETISDRDYYRRFFTAVRLALDAMQPRMAAPGAGRGDAAAPRAPAQVVEARGPKEAPLARGRGPRAEVNPAAQAGTAALRVAPMPGPPALAVPAVEPQGLAAQPGGGAPAPGATPPGLPVPPAGAIGPVPGAPVPDASTLPAAGLEPEPEPGAEPAAAPEPGAEPEPVPAPPSEPAQGPAGEPEPQRAAGLAPGPERQGLAEAGPQPGPEPEAEPVPAAAADPVALPPARAVPRTPAPGAAGLPGPSGEPPATVPVGLAEPPQSPAPRGEAVQTVPQASPAPGSPAPGP